VLILDEATSCLDAPGEATVLENIQRHLPASTLVVVSHRLSTFAAFDRVLILSGGRIVNDCRRPEVLARAQNARPAFVVSETANSYELLL
jgi:ABC-type bacteriocin/lantibiotic exporter with double-glycine peptidase domain